MATVTWKDTHTVLMGSPPKTVRQIKTLLRPLVPLDLQLFVEKDKTYLLYLPSDMQCTLNRDR